MLLREEKPVLIITPFFRPNIGGVETRFDEITKALSRRGIPVYVLTFQPLTTGGVRGESYEESENIKIWRFPWVGGDLFHKLLRFPVLEFLYLGVPLFLYSFAFLLVKKRKYHLNVIHVAGLNATLVGVFLRLFFKFRLVCSTHALYSFDKGSAFSKIISAFLNKTDLVLAIAKESKKELVKIGVKKEKIVVQPTWVNHDVFKKLPKTKLKKEFGLTGKLVFGFAGRLYAIKGINEILQVAKELEYVNDVCFVFVGTGELESLVEERAKASENIYFFGKVPNYEIARYMSSFDVFLAPAQYPEGFSRVVVEALSCGLPVLATNVGCLPEIVNNDVGWLIPMGAKALKKEIKNIVKDKASLKKISENSFKYSRKRFNEATVKELIKAYNL